MERASRRLREPIQYILDGKRVVPASSLEQWARFMEDTDSRRVADTSLRGCRVSTLCLGLDHRFIGEGPPLVFETMVVGGPLDQDTQHYATWQEAEHGHWAAVRAVREAVPPWWRRLRDLCRRDQCGE